MELVIDQRGAIRCVYAEAVDMARLGQVQIDRASRVEPDSMGHWYADLSPVRGPRLGPFARRSDALRAEQQWLMDHWLFRRSRL
jgi:hypothetical protein